MTDQEKENIYYVCALVEFVGRRTQNTNREIIKMVGKTELARQLEIADTSHCLSFEEVGDELIEACEITMGTFDSVRTCEYDVPSYISIGGVYSDLIIELIEKENNLNSVDVMYDVFTSFISDEISNFNTSTFYENPSFIYHSYLKGELVD